MGKGSSQPSATTSTVTQTDIPAYAKPYVLDSMRWAQGVSKTPYEAYSGPRIAPFSGDQQNAFNLARDLPNAGNQQFGAANNITGLAALAQGSSGYNAGQITNPYSQSNFSTQAINPQQVGTGAWNSTVAQQYMDPFIAQVMDTALARNQDAFARDRNARNSRAVGAGAFGGLRQGVEDAVYEQQFRMNQAAQEAGLLSQGYNQAFSGFSSDQARALQASMANQATGLQADTTNQSNSLERQRMQEAAKQFGASNALSFGQANQQNLQQQAQIGQQQAQGLASIGNQFSQLGKTERDAASQSIDALRNVGLDQQRQTQASLDLGYQDFINQRDYEKQMLSFYNSMLRGMPMSANSNVISYEQSNPYSQTLGAGLTALSLSNALGNNGKPG